MEAGLPRGLDRRNRANVTTAQTESSGGPGAQRQPAKIFYAPKPIQPMPYLAPMNPLVRLADLKARHAGQANWSELVVYDKNNRAEVISAAPGSKVPRHLHSDAPEYWVVQEGRIRFEIEDPPGKFKYFEAAKGDLVLAARAAFAFARSARIRAGYTLSGDTARHHYRLRNQTGACREGHGIRACDFIHRQ